MMRLQGFKNRLLAGALALLTGLFYCGVAEAVVISVDTTWTDPGALNDSLIINPGVTLRILNGNAIDGGDLIINLPNGGIFQIQNGGILNMNARLNNGRAGDLTVNLTGPAGNIDISGILVAQGLGTGRGGMITLNGSSFTLASTGAIYANSPYGLGGSVTMNNASGVINVANGFQVYTNGQSDASHNLIAITGTGVNVDGILNANGTAAGTGSDGGTVNLLATGAGQTVTVTDQIFTAGTLGNDGGTISITASGAGGDIVVNNGGQLIASSAGGGTNLGNGGTVTLTANDAITITEVNGSYVINVSAAESPATTTGNGAGGSVIMSAGGDIDILATAYGNKGVIVANGADGGVGAGGTFQIRQGNNLNISSTAARFMVQANGGKGTANVSSGNGGNIYFGAGAGSSALTGDIDITNSVLYATAGQTENMATGEAGNAIMNFAGDYTGNTAIVQTISAGNGGGGVITVNSTGGGDITLNDLGSYFFNRTDGNGVVTVTGNNILNNGTIASRAARVAHATPAPNANHGGTVNITAAGTVTNNGDINASAWSPGLSAISSGDESTGQGGSINITAANLVNNGNAASDRMGRIYAHGGLNTAGETQGNGGKININLSGSFSDNALGKIDSRGMPVNASNPTTGKNRIYISAGRMNVNGRINSSGFYSNDPGGYLELRTTGGDMNINSGALVSASGGIGDVFNNQAAGGTVVLNSAGNMNIAGNVTAIGQTGFAGGNITATAAGNINLLASGNVDSSGIANGTTNNFININGNSLSINGTLNASSAAGRGGNINATVTGGAANTSSFGIGNYDVSGTSAGGTIHLTSAGTLTNNTTLNDSQTHFILESTNGDVNVNSNITGYEIGLVTNGAGADIDINRSLTTTGNAAGGNGGNISITSADAVTVDNTINFEGHNTGGGSGGTLTITSGGNIVLNSALNGEGWAATATRTSNGGTVDINAGGSFTMNTSSQIDVDSVARSNITTNNANGGTVTIDATGVTINTITSTDSIKARGATFRRNGQNGGNGGTVTVTSTSFIDFNDTSSNGYYFDTRGGGSNRARGGNGGNVSLNWGTTKSIDNENTDPGGSGNFYRTGGSGRTGNGTNGILYYNGVAQ